MQLEDDLLLCPAAALSVGLSRFVHEVKQPDGESYSPDDLFYILLSIQQVTHTCVLLLFSSLYKVINEKSVFLIIIIFVI